MTSIGVLQIAIFFGLILICTKPLGAFMAKLFEGQRTFLHPVLRWLEVLTYKLIGVKEEVEQRWTQYTAALLSFSLFGFLLTYLLQRAQGFCPSIPSTSTRAMFLRTWHSTRQPASSPTPTGRRTRAKRP